MRSLLGVSFVWICVGACGGGVDINATASNVCSEIAKVACHNLYQCCAEGEIEDFLGVEHPRTESECQEDVRRMCVRSIARFDAAIEADRVRFESSVMNDCLESLVAPSGTCASVDETLPWAEACMNSAWAGLVADGGQCFGSFECAGADSFCAPNQTCTARPTDGQPCGASGCATGFFCELGTCRPQLAGGQPCTSALQCRAPLFCDFASAAPTCTEVRDGGEPCTSSNGCKSNQCIPGTCAGSTQSCFTDANCSGRCADGSGACTQDFQCSLGQCSVSMTDCSSTAGCPIGETCVFPVTCNPGDCVGDPVCAQAQIVVDYCEDALGDLPFPATN